MMLQAFVLAALVCSGRVRYWHVAVLATIYGLGRAVDIPARQAFVTDLVGKPDLPNAVALNSIIFNTARIVGPAVAGLLIARFGVAMAFLLNGISFLAVLAALLAMRTDGRPDPAGRVGLRAGLIGALTYAAATPTRRGHARPAGRHEPARARTSTSSSRWSPTRSCTRARTASGCSCRRWVPARWRARSG